MDPKESAKHIDILGLRGFSTNQRLELAIPNGKVGSGLTIVVGQNNALFTRILSDLGFKRIVGVLDGDHPEMADQLKNEFPMYRFFVIPAPDIRTKPNSPAKTGKEGLLDSNGKLQPQFRQQVSKMISDANSFLTSSIFHSAP